MSIQTVSLVGTSFRGAEVVKLVKSLLPKSPVILKPEPTNRYDSNAVMVFYGPTHIGYIAKMENYLVFAYLSDNPPARYNAFFDPTTFTIEIDWIDDESEDEGEIDDEDENLER